MSDDLGTLTAQRDRLLKIRANGLRSAEYGDQRVEYKTDGEIQTALLDLERRIAAAARPPVRLAVFTTSKGT